MNWGRPEPWMLVTFLIAVVVWIVWGVLLLTGHVATPGSL